MAADVHFARGLNTIPSNPFQQSALRGELALASGSWVKLICGASNQDLLSITDLCAVFAAAGIHCVDVAADAAVVRAARQGLDWVQARSGFRPWLMVSISDGKDAHFRKAWFDPARCPSDCSRPCQHACPAEAIGEQGGVQLSRCYGCGRCLPTCPLGLIDEHDRRLELRDFGPLLAELHPDAVEIHTAPGRVKAFESTVAELMSAQVPLQRIGVSCGLEGHGLTVEALASELWQRHVCLRRSGQRPLWQLDGRPMSGDIGSGTARVAVALWRKLRPLAPPGPLQLAGGTNAHTITYISSDHGPAGIAFGGMARRLLQPWLLEAQARHVSLREWPEGWQAALAQAEQLVRPWLFRQSGS
ncbi:putative oxidoreductase Fe-S binding subunit [Prochlorococcus marinus str. MIT 1313]|nr:putative oxidoreductase Fe-S binding subunit [Prochlorococcus marinus str. MIT 1313]KZR71421.1 putative oxidoreductase Fe-S binding subunit [Prochlorococcus marinus str. MIT 1318]